MTDYFLGRDAFVAASHITFTLVVLILFYEVQRFKHLGGTALQLLSSRYLYWSALMMLSMVTMERVYYGIARSLKPTGLNLWAMHPGPEMIAFGMMLFLFNLAMTPRFVLSETGGEFTAAMLRYATALLSFYAGTVWLMY